ncbi:MAG: hypothetical protein HC933_20025 [Pleurocapsa sp. SU_196_0]|nr:hypothetical protein [Pleurocapsa sp. SU_196_0]
MSVETFEEYQSRTLPPPSLQRPRPRVWLESQGALKDLFVIRLLEAMKQRFAESADEQALTIIGAERGLQRSSFEDLNAYRVRVLDAWNFWTKAGTRAGVEGVIRTLGYEPTVIELHKTTPERWAEFVVILRPGVFAFGALFWADDGVWADDATWGFETNPAEIPRIVNAIKDIKAVHSRLAAVHVVASGSIWGEDDLWADDGIWESGETALIYDAW